MTFLYNKFGGNSQKGNNIIIENIISKTVDITNKDNNDLFLVFNVIHIRYSVVKIM